MTWSFYDEITEIQYGKYITAYKTFSPSEDFFHDHFPGYPVVPGTIQVEALAQIAGRLIAVSQYHHHLMEKKSVLVLPLLVMVDRAVFRKLITANQRITLQAEITKLLPDTVTVNGRICLGNDLATRVRLVFSLLYGDERDESNVGLQSRIADKTTATALSDSIWDYLREEGSECIKKMFKEIGQAGQE
jgi:3-hydroxymyristoyl/3-hydroxydecanoyl-(acyl carrier protein) dehydratase